MVVGLSGSKWTLPSASHGCDRCSVKQSLPFPYLEWAGKPVMKQNIETQPSETCPPKSRTIFKPTEKFILELLPIINNVKHFPLIKRCGFSSLS